MTNLKDLAGEAVLNDLKNVIAALKLQELIKKKIKALPKQIRNSPSQSWKADYELLYLEFKTLIEDSEK